MEVKDRIPQCFSVPVINKEVADKEDESCLVEIPDEELGIYHNPNWAKFVKSSYINLFM